MRAVITGASKGIGAAIAEKLASEGCDVFLIARSEDHLKRTCSSILSAGNTVSCSYHTADLSDISQAQASGKIVLETFGVPDILINNAGQFIPGSLYNEPPGTMETMMNTNFYSAYHLTRELIPGMMSGKSGHIINICSIASIQAYPDGGAYSVSKFALLGFSKNLRETGNHMESK